MERYEALQSVKVNGVCLHYAEAGEGAPVVLVHGNGEDHALFETEIAQLATAGYHVYAPDSRGHGANEPLEEYHYADMAEDVCRFIEALGLGKPAFYGHSDGGIIGLMAELRHPGTFSLLAVSGTNLSPDGVTEEFQEKFRAMNEAKPDPLITLMLTEPDIDPEALRSIRIPVLVTVGDRDLIKPEETERIVSHLPDPELVVVEDADHGSYIDHSEIMGDMLVRFFRKHGYGL